MARVVIGESAEEMRFGDFLEEYVFMVFRIEKLLRKVDYFQEPDEILIEDTTKFETQQVQEGDYDEQGEERGYEICTVMEDSNEDEIEESGSSSRRNQKRSPQKTQALTDANHLLASNFQHDTYGPNYHVRSSYDGNQSQDSQNEKPRSLGDVSSELESHRAILSTLTPEKRISLKATSNLYPNVISTQLEEAVTHSLSSISQKKTISNVNDLLGSILNRPDKLVSPVRLPANHAPLSASLPSRDSSPHEKQSADLRIDDMADNSPADQTPRPITGKHKFSGSKDDSFSHIMDLESPEKSSVEDSEGSQKDVLTPRVQKYGLCTEGAKAPSLDANPEERKNSKVCIIENLESQIYDLIKEAKKVATNSNPQPKSFDSATTIGPRETRILRSGIARVSQAESRHPKSSMRSELPPQLSQSPPSPTQPKLELIRRHEGRRVLPFEEKKSRVPLSDGIASGSYRNGIPSKLDGLGSGLLKMKGKLAVAQGGYLKSIPEPHNLFALPKPKQNAQQTLADLIAKSGLVEKQLSQSREASDNSKNRITAINKPMAITQYHPASKQVNKLVPTIQTITTPLFKSTEHVKHLKLKTRPDEHPDSRSITDIERRSFISEAKDSQSILTGRAGTQKSEAKSESRQRNSLSPGPLAHQVPSGYHKLTPLKQTKQKQIAQPQLKLGQLAMKQVYSHQAGLSNLTQFSGGNAHFDSYIEERSNGQAERSCSIPLSDQNSRTATKENLLSSREDILVTQGEFFVHEKSEGIRLRGSFDGARGLDAATNSHAKAKTGNHSARHHTKTVCHTERTLHDKDPLHESPTFKKSQHKSVEKQNNSSSEIGLQFKRKQEFQGKYERVTSKLAVVLAPRQKPSSSFVQASAAQPHLRPRTSSNPRSQGITRGTNQKVVVPKPAQVVPKAAYASSALSPRPKGVHAQVTVPTFKPSPKLVDLELLQKKLKGSVGVGSRRKQPSKLERSVHL
jgi:hypothetical protein